MIAPSIRCPCEGAHLESAFEYDQRPDGETAFDLRGSAYVRRYERCRLCAHWFSAHQLDLSAIYSGAYVETTYGDRLHATFERVRALPPEQSDNVGRMDAIEHFARGFLGGTAAGERADNAAPPRTQPWSVLDIGAGLAVFPYGMHERGWRAVALDPDERAVAHAADVLGLEAVCEDFSAPTGRLTGQFDAITFNKVLEHVEDPVSLLARAETFLAPGGFVYLEVPDGEAAATEGQGREEFFIEHHHVFSAASTAMMVQRAGLQVVAIETLREPSTKFTVRAFATRP